MRVGSFRKVQPKAWASTTFRLVIRPDGHVGLRADRNHHDALAAYQALLR
jgi:hypothetical protein